MSGKEHSSDDTRAELRIKNLRGLHARPASMFVQTACGFESEITVEKSGEKVNGKSLMSLLMLSAGCGAKIKISAKGHDAAAAVAALTGLVENKFEEE
jgi:phosphocarrier protein